MARSPEVGNYAYVANSKKSTIGALEFYTEWLTGFATIAKRYPAGTTFGSGE